jgi:hypothetical protein
MNYTPKIQATALEIVEERYSIAKNMTVDLQESTIKRSREFSRRQQGDFE